MKTLKNLIQLSQQVKVYIPSTINIVEEIDTKEQVRKCLAILADYFGVATSHEGLGAWITKEGKLITERVTICQAFCDELGLNTHIDHIYHYCVSLKTDLKQEAIALEVNNILHFV